MEVRNTDARGSVAALVTAYRIGPILTDTLTSVLSQRDVDLAAVVLVVDGCTMTATTQAIARRFTRAHPNFRTIWLENGGVARARNTGVRWLLEQFPDLEAVFVLDGDDLVPPLTVASSLDTLRKARAATPQEPVGWVYFDQVRFGAKTGVQRYPRHFSEIRWLGSNLSQPSSLYSADMFRQGVLWDENMVLGIEDWEFWQQGIAAGFRGAYDGNVTVKYRQLAGNRSSLNRSKDALTKRYMRGKHSALAAPRRLLGHEQNGFPRWAIRGGHGGAWRLTSDPDGPSRQAGEERPERAFAARLAQQRADAYFFEPYFPDLAASLPEAVESALARAGLLHSLLYRVECELAHRPVVALRMVPDGAEAIEVSHTRLTAQDLASREAVFLSTIALTPVWLATGDVGEIEAVEITLTGMGPPSSASGDHASFLLELGDACRRAGAQLHDPTFYREENRHVGADKASHGGLGRELLGFWPMAPILPAETTRTIALVLPDEPSETERRFVDQVLNPLLDKESRIYLVGAHARFIAADRLPDLPVAGRLALGTDPGKERLPPERHYFGVPLSEKLPRPLQDRIVGQLCTMDQVVNLHGPALAGAMIALKKLGVATTGFFDPDSVGPTSDPMQYHSHTAAYEQIHCLSPDAALRLEAIGVPRARIELAS